MHEFPIEEIYPYRAYLRQPSKVFGIDLYEGTAMSAKEPRHLMSEAEMDRAIAQMARQIVEEIGDASDVLLAGIRSRGVPLAEWLAEKLQALTGRPFAVGSLDINLYRDDLSEVDRQPIVRQTEFPTPVDGKGVILVDDVLYTGRTIRAALDALVDFGRPRFVKLAVLVDRGFRELPIQADYVGKRVKTTVHENVKVMLKSVDGVNQVLVKEQT